MSELDCGSQGCLYANHNEPSIRMASTSCYCRPDSIKKHIQSLEAKLKIAVEALEFYAGIGAYGLEEVSFNEDSTPCCYFYTIIKNDHEFFKTEYKYENGYGGKRARQALKQIKGKKHV